MYGHNTHGLLPMFKQKQLVNDQEDEKEFQYYDHDYLFLWVTMFSIILISYAKLMQHDNKFHFDPLNE